MNILEKLALKILLADLTCKIRPLDPLCPWQQMTQQSVHPPRQMLSFWRSGVILAACWVPGSSLREHPLKITPLEWRVRVLLRNLQQCVHSLQFGGFGCCALNKHCGNFPVPSLGSSFSSSPSLPELGPGISSHFLLPPGAVATPLKAHGWLQTQLDLATATGCKLRDNPLSLCALVPKKTAKGKREAVSKAKQPLGD